MILNFVITLSVFTCFFYQKITTMGPVQSGTVVSISLLQEQLCDRFNPPHGFKRTLCDSLSFGQWLRMLPLKPEGSKVKYFDGREKNETFVYAAVVDLAIGNKNLHQCADAVIRLWAEYLYNQGRYEDIKFHFTNGFLAEYSKWMEGYRIRVTGHDVQWVKKVEAEHAYESFWQYLETVFTYAGTLSLEKELDPVSIKNMQIGDVFIQGGSPGHAVIIVDMAEDTKTGRKVFMLAQSYMPAQEIQILTNPNDPQFSPWYDLDFGVELDTPEWSFKAKDLKRF
jgi:hypothetical protein